MKTLRLRAGIREIDLASRGAPLTDLQAGSEERARLYHTARWQRARRWHLQSHPLCRQCEEVGRIVAAVAVDHRDGHRYPNWRERFWDTTTWQSLCADCHNRKSAAELAAWNRAGAGVDHG